MEVSKPEFISIIFNMELTHLGSEASIYLLAQNWSYLEEFNEFTFNLNFMVL